MNCFRPDPYDYSLKAVPKTFETAKALVIRLEEGKIELCSHKGTLLESVSLTDVQWSPCSLPAGGDHCLSLQFKQPQPREILLSAKSRAAVHHLIRALDRAASKHKGGKSSDTPVKEETKSSSTSQQRPVTRDAGTLAGIESHDVNKANEFQRILEEQENHWVRQIQSLEKDLQLKISDMKREVEAARAKAKSMETKNVDLEVKLKDSVASITSEKAKVGEMSLERERLKTSFLQVQEEKEILISALTNAQAQLHDVQKDFRDTVAQLESASIACAEAKRQAAIEKERLEKVEEENCRHKDEIRDVNEQLKALQLARDGLEAELEEKQRHWAQEKQRMEVDLSRMLETHQPNNSQSEVSKWRSIAEASKIETARAEAVLESHRKGEEEATKEVESLRERLATSLANYVAIVQEKNDLEKTLDHVKVDLQRARRKVDALESRDRYRTLRSSSEPFENTNPDSDIQPTAEFTDR